MKKTFLITITILVITVLILGGCAESAPAPTKETSQPQVSSPEPWTEPEEGQAEQTEEGQAEQTEDSQRPRPPRKKDKEPGDAQLPGSAPQDTEPVLVQEDELNQNNPQAFNGYTLFAPKHYTTTYLMDNDGHIINSWKSNYEPGQSVYLLENGHLVHCNFTKNKGFIGGGEGGGIEEYDWEGNMVWEFWYTSDKYLMHHDIEPMPNGNILALVVEKKSYADCIAAGFNPAMLRDKEMFPDYVIEIEKTGSRSGRIVWEWHVWDHLIQDYDPSKANYGDVEAYPELVDANGSGRQTPAFWNHMNSIDYNEELDQMMLSVRGNSELWVIDHSTTSEEAAGHTGGRSGKGGDLLYRWGNPQTYQAGDSRDQQLLQQHDAQWIESGLPGEGNILIFNNGLGRGYSTVDEIVPPVDSNGNYSLTSGSAYGPKEPIWTYKAENAKDFYAEAISGCQRLPNGNTLICDGTHGVFFEVNPNGETVWKYVNPVIGTGPIAEGATIPLDHRGHQLNAVFKIHRYAPEYPGLAGKDLTPGSKL